MHESPHFPVRIDVLPGPGWARRRNSFAVSVALVLLLVLSPGLSFAARSSLETHPLEPPDTSSPRATLQSFRDDMREGGQLYREFLKTYYQEPGLLPSESAQKIRDRAERLFSRAIRHSDFSQVPETHLRVVSIEVTILILEILDRISLPPPNAIPDATLVEAEGISRWSIPHTEITIARVKEGPRAGEFLFSPSTVDRAKEFYRKVQHLPYKPDAWEGVFEFYRSIGGYYVPHKLIDALPAWAKQRVLGQAVWQVIGFTIAALLALAGLFLIYRWSRARIEDRPREGYLRRVAFPVAVMIAAGLLEVVQDELNITGSMHQNIATALGAVFFIAAGWTVLLVGNWLGEGIILLPRIKPRSIDAAMVRLTARFISFIVFALIILHGAHSLGLPITPILAGLGVGGLALALAAQPTIENFIAGLTLYADRPVRVGEFCRFGDKLGTVEEIGMRSTRIRTLADTLVTVPNAQFAKIELDNYTRRRKFWYHPRIRLRYETTPDQIRYILVEIRRLLYAHPKMLAEEARIRFTEFGTYSLDLEIFAYAVASEYAEFLEIAEDLNLRIMDVVSKAGSGLAVPAWRTYSESGKGLDEKLVREAEKRVKEWKDKNALYLPGFPDEKIAEIAGSLDYPPKGSPGSSSGSDKPSR